MKKEIYLVQSCPKDEFRKAAKEGSKCNAMGLHGRVLPVYATWTKKEAIKDCRYHNRMAGYDTIFYINLIAIFC